MEPIVSPGIIYVIGLLDTMKVVAGIIAWMGVAFCIIVAIFCMLEPEAIKVLKENKKTILIPMIIGVVLVILIPSREEMIGMLIAQYITTDKVDITNELIKSNLQDYVNIIVDGINKTK